MRPAFSQTEIAYLIAWAREDHLGLVDGPARALLRQHGTHPAVMGQLFAQLSTMSGHSQFEMVNGPASKDPIDWPWPTPAVLEARLHEILPESTVHYLDELGALKATETALPH